MRLSDEPGRPIMRRNKYEFVMADIVLSRAAHEAEEVGIEAKERGCLPPRLNVRRSAHGPKILIAGAQCRAKEEHAKIERWAQTSVSGVDAGRAVECLGRERGLLEKSSLRIVAPNYWRAVIDRQVGSRSRDSVILPQRGVLRVDAEIGDPDCADKPRSDGRAHRKSPTSWRTEHHASPTKQNEPWPRKYAMVRVIPPIAGALQQGSVGEFVRFASWCCSALRDILRALRGSKRIHCTRREWRWVCCWAERGVELNISEGGHNISPCRTRETERYHPAFGRWALP